MQDEIVKYATARLAKAKGFDENCNLFYDKKTVLYGHPENMGCNSLSEFPIFCCSAPTQTLLQRWLRENHRIECSAAVNFYNKSKKLGYYYSIDRFNSVDIHDGKDYDFDQLNLIGDKQAYNTFEDALEIAIVLSLKLI